MSVKDIGKCEKCHQMIRETQWGSIVGHLPNCPDNPDKKD